MEHPGGPRPAASIVIPLWNNVAYTHACLVRLAAATPAGTYEVVLVDNGSTDGTAELLAGLSGDVQIVRNDRNLGFARACNQGAEVATGRHLVFLNNDTEPHPGWLEPLVEILDTEPDVGVVGSKLLFPNGLVQHAGVGMARSEVRDELYGYHRLYLSVPDDAVVDARADLQAVTGAALAIRRDLFSAVGEFDEAYWNGNEDVDLCLKIREAGYRVVYEPRSTLTHHESVSGPERFSRVADNVRIFNQRWGKRTVPDTISDSTAGSMVPGPDDPEPRLRHDAVHVVGPVGPGGRPNRAMALAAELLADAGIDHDVTTYRRTVPPGSPPAYSLNGTGGSCGILLICAEPDAVASFLAERGPGFVDNRYVIALWEWPAPSVPEANLDAVRMAHEFWVPTTALQSYAASMSDSAAVVLPAFPGEPSPFSDQIRSVTGTVGRLTFTAAVDLSAGPSFHDRFEDALVAIASFVGSFGAGEAGLLVGVTGGRHLPWTVQGLIDLAGTHPGVSVIDLDPAGIGTEQLAAAGDCHVALTGARGFAPTSLAAMQAGVPVVAVADPANPAVMTGANSYLLDPTGATGPAELVALVSRALRDVAGNPSGREARGRRAAADVAGTESRTRAVGLVRERVGRAGHLLERLGRVAHR